MSRAQIQNVFGFILVGLVIVATVLLSVRLVLNIADNACEAEKNQMIRTLHEIEESYDTRGVRQELNLRVACGAQTVCFVGEEPPAGYDTSSLFVPERIKVLLRQSAELASQENVYLVKDDVLIPLERFDKLATDNIFCKQNNGGRAKLVLEGTGFDVKVS